jgi:predicted aspartyl protease
LNRTFPYRAGESQRFPAVPLTVVSTRTGAEKKVLFRLDTGADMTVVPFHILDDLMSKPHGKIIIGDYDSHQVRTPFFLVHLRLGDVLFDGIPVAPSQSGNALLGIDILNQLKVTLDGPKKSLIIH